MIGYIGPAVSFVKGHLSKSVFAKLSKEDEMPPAEDESSDEESLYSKDDDSFLVSLASCEIN